MENEEDYLSDMADLLWQKQEERDKKSQELEQYLDSLSDDDIDDLRMEDQRRKSQNRCNREAKIKEERLLEAWKELNPQESKIWQDKWNYYSHYQYYEMASERKSEIDVWKQWLYKRNENAKEKADNLDIWHTFHSDKYESEIIDGFSICSTITENDNFFEVFEYFNQWKNDHIKEWSKYKETFIEEWTEEDSRNFLSKGAYVNASNQGENMFELWQKQNLVTWEKWKGENLLNWQTKIHELYIWTSWVHNHPIVWDKWAEVKLERWRKFRQQTREWNIISVWSEDHGGTRDEFELWKLENSDDWEMWEKELQDRIEWNNWDQY